MIRSEESKRQWKLAEAARDWETMDSIEAEWEGQGTVIDYPGDEQYVWEGEDDMDYATLTADDEDDLTADEEDALELWEEERRRKLAEANEY